MLHIYRLSASMLAYIHVQSCSCPPDGFCIALDTIAYAKVSGADSIAWRTQLHLTPVPPDGFCIAPDTIAYAKVSGADSIAWRTKLHLTPVISNIITTQPHKANHIFP